MLEANAFCAGDEYLIITGDECIENARSSVSHTPTARLVYVRLHLFTSKFQTEFMLRQFYTSAGPGDGPYHVAGVQQVPTCTTAFSVALNWSSRPSK